MPESGISERLGKAAPWLLSLLAAVWVSAVQAADEARWIASWTASPQPIWDKNYPADIRVPSTISNRTLRQIAHISLGGKRIRIMISNEYGTQPLVIGEAHVGLSGGGALVTAGTDRKLTFGGHGAISIPPGAPVFSDPVDLPVAPLSDIAVSLYLPETTPLTTFHWDGLQTAYMAAGNATGASDLKVLATSKSRVFLSGILVETPRDAYTVAAFGDSLTDGNATTPDANRRWPDILAQRLAKEQIAVINAGISGSRMLKDRMGANALARFDHDVLTQPGVKAVVVLMGINDIGWPGSIDSAEPPISSEELIAGYRQLIARAHVHGVRIIGGTLTPFAGVPRSGYYTAEKERVRQAANQWIRTSGEFDAVVDFDAMMRDPAHPTRFLPDYDAGDHLHPNDTGNKAMAEGIDLKTLRGNP